MISIDKLKTNILKCRETYIEFPSDNKFTQNTAIDIRIKELTKIINNKDSIRTQIVNNITNKDHINNVNLNITNENYTKKYKKTSILVYNEHDTLEIPDFLTDIFNKDDLKNLYIYGITNPDSFYKSICLCYSSDYILASNSEKSNIISTKRREFAVSLNNIFKKYKYAKFGYRKAEISNNLLETNIINYPLLVYISDYVNMNLCIIDIDNKTYKFIKNYNTLETENNNDTNECNLYILLKFNTNTYVPILNTSSTEHYHSKSVLEKIKEKYILEDVKENERIFINENENENNSNNNIQQLNDISKYSLKDLQKLALQCDIEITKEGKTKTINKLKNELYKELKEYLN